MQKLGKGEALDDDEYNTWLKAKQLMKPDDQLDLTDAELGEEVPKVLTTENTHLSRNLVIFNFKEGAYVPLPHPPSTITLLEYEGTAIHIETEEAIEQISRKGSEGKL